MSICLECNKEFSSVIETTNKKIETNRIVCNECKPLLDKDDAKKIIIQCDACHIFFGKLLTEMNRRNSHHNFCSKKCCNVYRKNKAKHHHCSLCKKIFKRVDGSKGKVFCEECRNNFISPQTLKRQSRNDIVKSYTLEQFFDKKIKTNSRYSIKQLNGEVRNKNRVWNKELTELPCIACGYTKHVELAHIKDVADFSMTATLIEVNGKANSIPLCPTHHWEFDNDQLDPQNKEKIDNWIAIRKNSLSPKKLIIIVSKPYYAAFEEK